MSWVGLQYMIVAFPVHALLLFGDLSLYELYLAGVRGSENCALFISSHEQTQ